MRTRKRALSWFLAFAMALSLLPWTGEPANAFDMGKVGQTVTVSVGDFHTAAIKTDGGCPYHPDNAS